MVESIIYDCKIGENTKVWNYANLYGCEIGDNCMIGSYVEIAAGAKVGNNVKIQTHSFICDLVTIEDDVFIGPNVTFVNDRFPRSKKQRDFCKHTLIRKGASLGAGAIIMCGVDVGKNAMIGAGAVVTKDVYKDDVVVGNSAKSIRN